MNLPTSSFYLVDQELYLTLLDHVLLLLCAVAALPVAAVGVAAVVVVVFGGGAALAVHVESWQVNVHLWKFSVKARRQQY